MQGVRDVMFTNATAWRVGADLMGQGKLKMSASGPNAGKATTIVASCKNSIFRTKKQSLGIIIRARLTARKRRNKRR